MSISIRDCQVDQEFRDAIPRGSSDERAELKASVERFGYLSPILAWVNERGECLILDGHNRWDIWRAAGANPSGCGLARSEPPVKVLNLASRDDALLFVIGNQLARRNIADIDRIALVSKREDILRRKAKANQSAAGKQTMLGKTFATVLSVIAPKAGAAIHTRKESAAEAGVSERTYDAGKQILEAVADGQLLPQIVDEIRNGKETIHGVAKTLTGKPKGKGKLTSKPKSAGWQAVIRQLAKSLRRVIQRDPQRRAEIASELRRLASEFESAEQAVAA